MVSNNNLQQMSADQLTNQIINGRAGSRQSREAIVELIRRNKAVRAKIRRLNIPEAWSDETWGDYIKQNRKAIQKKGTLATVKKETEQEILASLIDTISLGASYITLFFASSMLIGLFTYNETNSFSLIISMILVSFIISGVINILKSSLSDTRKSFVILGAILPGVLLQMAILQSGLLDTLPPLP